MLQFASTLFLYFLLQDSMDHHCSFYTENSIAPTEVGRAPQEKEEDPGRGASVFPSYLHELSASLSFVLFLMFAVARLLEPVLSHQMYAFCAFFLYYSSLDCPLLSLHP